MASRDHAQTTCGALEGLADYLHDAALLAESEAANRVGGQRNRLLNEARDCRAWMAALSSTTPHEGERSREAINPSSALAPKAGNAGWRTIDSAPRDGTSVLVMADGVVAQAHYQGPSDGSIYARTASRYLWFSETGQRSLYNDEVTHWMPLPAPPPSSGSQVEGDGGET